MKELFSQKKRRKDGQCLLERCQSERMLQDKSVWGKKKTVKEQFVENHSVSLKHALFPRCALAACDPDVDVKG